MKKTVLIKPWLILLFSLACVSPSHAADIRIDAKAAQQKRLEALKESLDAEKDQAIQEAVDTKENILSGRSQLLEEINRLTSENKQLGKDIDDLTSRLAKAKTTKKKLEEKKRNIADDTKELTGHIRVSVKDMVNTINQSMQSAFYPDRDKYLTPLLDKDVFPGFEDVKKLADTAWEELEASGEVRIDRTRIIDKTGMEIEADVLVLGNFTAAYRVADDTGFLVYSNNSQRLIALANSPPYLTRRKLARYMNGESEDTPIDISRGAGVRQLSNEVSLLEQIRSGGLVVWPILAILVFGVILILERVVMIFRKKINSSRLLDRISDLILKGDLEECHKLCSRYSKKPVPLVLLAGIENRGLSRGDLENVLQETIMGQIPPLERFLSTIGMLATISPLLGLLGTVTGMINTFHVITFFGTGDARMMSGGISEALVTTMLGLSVAIPIMFGHTFISRAIENIIAQMEEKAVALVNSIEKERTTDDTNDLGID